jgi:hypothetical protein
MNATTVLLLTGVLTATTTFAAIDVSKLPPPSDKQGVTYEKDILPIFKASCIRCHGEEKPKGHLSLDTLEGVLKGGKDGKVVVPGNSAKSDLVVAISRLDPEFTMPPKPRARRGAPGNREGNQAKNHEGGMTNQPPAGGPPRRMQGPPPKPLTPEQVGLVRAWIDQGAK